MLENLLKIYLSFLKLTFLSEILYCEPAPMDLELRKIWVFKLVAVVVAPSSLLSPFSVGNLCRLKLKVCHEISFRPMNFQEITANNFCAIPQGPCFRGAWFWVTSSLHFPRSVGNRPLCRMGTRAVV